jgi:solute carrier family 25 carnitine/acylcarnitine transporter 20/29
MSREQTTSRPAPVQLTAVEQYLCGVAGGLGKVVTGHPFDTIKSRVQSGAFSNSKDALVQTIRQEGARAMYQGMLPPCISVGCVSGILFFANARIRRYLQPDTEKQLTYTQMAIAGGGAGAVTAVILTPLDHMKLWMQVERRASGAAAAATSSTAASSSASNSSMSFAGYMARAAHQIGTPQLYRGFAATTLREIGTFGIFFPTNEYLKLKLGEARGVQKDQTLPLHLRVIAAGTSGVLCWLPCYPIDQIKSRQQLQGNPLIEANLAGRPAPPTGTGMQSVPWGKGRSMLAVGSAIMKHEGLPGFTRGIVPCLLRAFPTYTTQFTLFDILTTALKDRHRRAAILADRREQSV